MSFLYLDRFINMVNFFFCFLIFTGLTWAVISKRVKDGIVVKLGLIMMSMGFAGLAYHMWNGHNFSDVVPIQRAMLMIHAGMGIVFIGVLFKSTLSRHPVRRASDWVDSSLVQESKPEGQK